MVKVVKVVGKKLWRKMNLVTYNKFADDVLMERPPGPLADLDRAIAVCTHYWNIWNLESGIWNA